MQRSGHADRLVGHCRGGRRENRDGDAVSASSRHRAGARLISQHRRRDPELSAVGPMGIPACSHSARATPNSGAIPERRTRIGATGCSRSNPASRRTIFSAWRRPTTAAARPSSMSGDRDGGLAVGHVETTPRRVSLPVQGQRGGVRVAVCGREKRYLRPGETLRNARDLRGRPRRRLLRRVEQLPASHGRTRHDAGDPARDGLRTDLVCLGLRARLHHGADRGHAAQGEGAGLGVGRHRRRLAGDDRRLDSRSRQVSERRGRHARSGRGHSRRRLEAPPLVLAAVGRAGIGPLARSRRHAAARQGRRSTKDFLVEQLLPVPGVRSNGAAYAGADQEIHRRLGVRRTQDRRPAFEQRRALLQSCAPPCRSRGIGGGLADVSSARSTKPRLPSTATP